MGENFWKAKQKVIGPKSKSGGRGDEGGVGIGAGRRGPGGYGSRLFRSGYLAPKLFDKKVYSTVAICKYQLILSLFSLKYAKIAELPGASPLGPPLCKYQLILSLFFSLKYAKNVQLSGALPPGPHFANIN